MPVRFINSDGRLLRLRGGGASTSSSSSDSDSGTSSCSAGMKSIRPARPNTPRITSPQSISLLHIEQLPLLGRIDFDFSSREARHLR